MSEKIYNQGKERMEKTVLHYQSEISTIRTGRASTNLLDAIKSFFVILKNSFYLCSQQDL